VHERGIVAITCSSSGYDQCWQVADPNWTGYWHSQNMAQSWIQFDFKDRNVSVIRYAIAPNKMGSNFLRQWTLAGSSDGSSWETIDSRQTDELIKASTVKMFVCSPAPSTSPIHRYIRLTQTGLNSTVSNYLVLTHLEFFGSFIERMSPH
jgi:hypothetical protein